MSELKETPKAFVQAVQECREREERRMGRKYASSYEAWAKLRRMLEQAEAGKKTLANLREDIWNAIKSENEESVIVHLNAMASQAMDVCVLLATIVAEANRAAEDLADKL